MDVLPKVTLHGNSDSMLFKYCSHKGSPLQFIIKGFIQTFINIHSKTDTYLHNVKQSN